MQNEEQSLNIILLDDNLDPKLLELYIHSIIGVIKVFSLFNAYDVQLALATYGRLFSVQTPAQSIKTMYLASISPDAIMKRLKCNILNRTSHYEASNILAALSKCEAIAQAHFSQKNCKKETHILSISSCLEEQVTFTRQYLSNRPDWGLKRIIFVCVCRERKVRCSHEQALLSAKEALDAFDSVIEVLHFHPDDTLTRFDGFLKSLLLNRKKEDEDCQLIFNNSNSIACDVQACLLSKIVSPFTDSARPCNVTKLSIVSRVKSANICESLMFGSPFLLVPSLCRRLPFYALMDVRQKFRALCAELLEADLALVARQVSQGLQQHFALFPVGAERLLLRSLVTREQCLRHLTERSNVSHTGQQFRQQISCLLDQIPLLPEYDPYLHTNGSC